MSVADKKYKELIKEIAISGVWDKSDSVLPRTRYSDGGVAYSKSVFGVQVKFEQGEIPLLTSKKVFTTLALISSFEGFADEEASDPRRIAWANGL